MVLPLAGVLHPPDAAATGLARQHEAGDENARAALLATKW
jgi:hypothetical protein